MAKRKTEKIIDLKPTSITEEELKNVQELINLVNRGEMQIGSLEVKKHNLLHQVVSVQEQLGQLQKSFEATYGKANININDGTISYTDDEQADKKD